MGQETSRRVADNNVTMADIARELDEGDEIHQSNGQLVPAETVIPEVVADRISGGEGEDIGGGL
jgi:hypothetical protein